MNREDKKMLRHTAKYIARFVRDHLEDLHVEGVTMTDDNMPSINKAIRSGIYQYLYLAHQSLVGGDNRKKFFDDTMFLKSPPEYRENNVFNKVDKDIEETFTKFFEKN